MQGGNMADEVRNHFSQHHIHLKTDWLNAAITFIHSRAHGQIVDTHFLIAQVFRQWLYADIRSSTCSVRELGSLNSQCHSNLRNPYALQIQSVSDIGTSQLKQYNKLTKTDCNEEIGTHNYDSLDLDKGYSCFCLHVTDGSSNLKAFEHKRIPTLTTATCPGSKIVIFGGTKVKQGILFLTSKNCQLLGGAVEELVQSNDIMKRLAQQLEKPLPIQSQPRTATMMPRTSAAGPAKGVEKRQLPPSPEQWNTEKPLPIQPRATMPTAPRTSAAAPIGGKRPPPPVQQNIDRPSLATPPKNNNNNYNRNRTPLTPVQNNNKRSPKASPPTVQRYNNDINRSPFSPPLHPPAFLVQEKRPFPPPPVQQNASSRASSLSANMRPSSQQSSSAHHTQTYLADILRKLAFTIGPKRVSVHAIVHKIAAPFRIVDNQWAMSVILLDESCDSAGVECKLSHDVLVTLIGMTPHEAMAIKTSVSVERKKEGAERMQLMNEQLMRLDLVFEIEFLFRHTPVVRRVQTFAERMLFDDH